MPVRPTTTTRIGTIPILTAPTADMAGKKRARSHTNPVELKIQIPNWAKIRTARSVRLGLFDYWRRGFHRFTSCRTFAGARGSSPANGQSFDRKHGKYSPPQKI